MSRGSFTKIFSSLLESTVWCEPLATRVVWITMLAMADARGRVWASVPGLANRAQVTIEEAEAALARFLAPDRYSRTPDHEGRRIEPIDGGWRLLNYAKYREMRDEEARREYQREWDRARRRRPTRQSDKSDKIRQHPTQAEAEAERTLPSPDGEGVAGDAGPPALAMRMRNIPCPHEQIVGIWHEVMSDLPRIQLARWLGSKAETHLRTRWREALSAKTGFWRFSTADEGLAKFRELLSICRDSDFLMGRIYDQKRGPFKLNLHWLVRRENFDKVLANSYHREAA